MSRELSRQQLARRGVLVIVGIVLVGVLVSLRSNGTFGSAPHVSADVATAGGAMRSGADVKIDGVIIGEVVSIDRNDDGGVRLDLELDESDMEHVPANVVARILPATVFGTTYVDLVVHGEPSADPIRAGDEIGPDRSQETLELQQALDDIDRLVTALGPAELASAIGSAAQALDGRGRQLGGTVDTLNRYLDRLNPRMPAIRADLEAFASATRVVDRIAPDLLRATDDGLVFLDSLITQEAALTSLLTGGTELAATSTRFLDRNQRDLVRWINDAGALVDALYDNRRAGITDAISVNLALGESLPASVRNGFVEVDGVLRTSLPEYYRSPPSFDRSAAGIDAMVGAR